MIKEKFELLRKHGKKVVAGLLAAAMTIEQVPLEGTGGWLQSLAATGITNNEKVPGMFADIDNVRLVGGTETKERFLMLQKKREAQALIKLIPDGTISGTLYQPAIHIDTPYIFRDSTGNFVVTYISQNYDNGDPYGPDDYARDTGLQFVGGVAVALSGLGNTWTLWTPPTKPKTTSDDPDEEDEAVEIDDASDDDEDEAYNAVEDTSMADAKAEIVETSKDDSANEEEPADDAGEEKRVTADAEEKTKTGSASSQTEMAEKLESVLRTSEASESLKSETGTKKETDAETETGAESGTENETEKETEAVTRPADDQESDTASGDQKETESTVDSTEEKSTETADEADGTQTENGQTVQDSETDSESKTSDATVSGDTADTAGVVNNQDIDVYADSDNSQLIYEPDWNQMNLQGTTSTGTYYYGNIRVTLNDTQYDPSQNYSVTAHFKFFTANGYTGQFPEGLEAKCRAWVDMKGFSVKGVSGGGVVKGQYYVPRNILHPKSEFTFVYSNVDWDLSMEAVKGAEDNPVIPWQKNNYASYIMKIRNTSGLSDPDADTLTPDERVPNETTFSNYDVTVVVPNDGYAAKAYGSAWQYETYYWDEEAGVLKKNENYYKMTTDMFGDKKNSDVNFMGKWISNDLSNVGYDASRYDESGGAVVIDITDLEDGIDPKTEDPDELVAHGGIPIAYQWSTAATFTFKTRGEELYPPQFGLNGKGEKYDDSMYDPAKKTERVYRIFLPFNNNIKGSDGQTLEQDITYNGTIYIGGTSTQNGAVGLSLATNSDWDDDSVTSVVTGSHVSDGIALIDDRPQNVKDEVRALEEKQLKEAARKAELGETETTDVEEIQEEELGEEEAVATESEESRSSGTGTGWEKIRLLPTSDDKNLGHSWPSSDLKAATWFTIPTYDASGTKTVESADAHVGKKVTYTISDIGITNEGKGASGVPMYRPNVVDTFQVGFDLQELQFVYPKNSDINTNGKTPVEYWLGGNDDLLGIGIAKTDEEQSLAYPIMEYQDADGKWQEMLITSADFTVTGGDANHDVYSCRVDKFFDSIHFYPKAVRINFKYCWVPLTKCPGDIRLVGVSRIANEKLTNTAQTHFSILNYRVQQHAGYEQNLIGDPIGYFPVSETIKDSKESTADINTEKADIEAKIFAETWIKDQKKTDPLLLETPITRDYGNYLVKITNGNDSEGYNVNFTLKLNEKEQDRSEGAAATAMVDAFRVSGIRISKQLLEAGEQPYERVYNKKDPDRQPYKLDSDGNRIPAPILVLKNGDTVIKSFTYEELEKLISTTEEGINHSPKYVDKSCYINLTDAIIQRFWLPISFFPIVLFAEQISLQTAISHRTSSGCVSMVLQRISVMRWALWRRLWMVGETVRTDSFMMRMATRLRKIL